MQDPLQNRGSVRRATYLHEQMFARRTPPPIFAPEGLSWEFPSRADRGRASVPDSGRLGGAPTGSRHARLAPAARQAASAAKGAVHGAAAIARDLLLLADPELEAQAEQLARADDGSGSRAGDPCVTCAASARTGRARPRRTPRRPGVPVPSPGSNACTLTHRAV